MSSAPTLRTSSTAARPDVIAAGAVIVRKHDDGHQVLLVHRPRYDDWSFPKGKRDRGEHVAACAVREVAEETGLLVRLGVPLPDQRYRVAADRFKTVHYWMARAAHDTTSHFVPNDEVDELRWCSWEEARSLLSYARDRELLDEAYPSRRRTTAAIVLRHAKAMDRTSFAASASGPDARRPLTERGIAQARALVAPLKAWGAEVALTSPSTRCTETVAPYVAAVGLEADLAPALSEETADEVEVAARVARLVSDAEKGSGQAVLVCGHRPVLPFVFGALGVDPVSLPPSGWAVVHLRRGVPVAVEIHRPD